MHPDPEAFLECLEPLQPRLYSISSSPLATPGEVHLTVDAVRYDDRRPPAPGRRLDVPRRPAAAPARSVQVYVQKAHGFALPADPATPIIMVGPGTGIAPFRAFLLASPGAPRRRAAPGCSSATSARRPTSSIATSSQALLADGTLTRLSTAWSRDGDREGLRAGPHARGRRRAVGLAQGTARTSTSAATPSAWPRTSRRRSPTSPRRTAA